MRKILVEAFSILLVLIAIACAPDGTQVASQAQPETKPDILSRQAWEIEWGKNLQAARQEKQLNLYTTAGADIRVGFAKAMKEKFGLEMEFITGTGVALIQKLLTERKAGLYIGDVYIAGSTSTMAMLIPVGAIDPLSPELILPEVIDTKLWYGNKLPFIDKEEHLLGFRGSVFRPLTINTTLVKPEEITSYKDLLKSKFKGKIAMGDPSIGGAASSFVSMLGEYLMGYDFLRELVKQEPFISRDERLLTEWVARGKYYILIGTKPDPIAEFERVGAPLFSIVPKEGSMIEPGAGTVSVINRRPNPNAAKVFINWLLNKEGQTFYAEAAGIESSREDVSKAHLDPHLIRDPGKKYLFADEEFHKVAEKNWRVSSEIFAPVLK